MSSNYRKQKCIIPQCPSSRQTDRNSLLFSLHRIPKDESLKKKWIAFIKEQCDSISETKCPNINRTSVLCSLHFESNDFHNLQHFLKKEDTQVRLKEGTYPKIKVDNVNLNSWTNMDVVSYLFNLYFGRCLSYLHYNMHRYLLMIMI